MATHQSRKSHRRRTSALRLSSDTTSSLPEYIPYTPTFNSTHLPSDNPPDYPDSAEEADEDTDTDSQPIFNHSSTPATASPRRPGKRFLPPSHKRKQSSISSGMLVYPSSAPPIPSPDSTDPFLDSLLARSVHALEMSNTLLQSSISTQTSLSAILSHDSPVDVSLENRALNLSSRIVRDNWATDLDNLTRDVESLFLVDSDSASKGVGGTSNVASTSSSPRRSTHPSYRYHPSRSQNSSSEGGVSCSLPSSGSPLQRRQNKRAPSLDLKQASLTPTTNGPPSSRLNFTPQTRATLVAPAPRALTQYIESTQDLDAIILPSTLGIRSAPVVHRTLERKPSFGNPTTTSVTSLPPTLTDKPLEPSTPAYNMLSSFVMNRNGTSSLNATPSSSFTTSFMKRRRSSSVATSTTDSHSTLGKRRGSRSPVSSRTRASSDRTTTAPSSSASSRTQTPIRSRSPNRHGSATPGLHGGISQPITPLVLHRTMTPPLEESSSSSSDGPVAKQTVKSLRKILDDQPPAPLAATSSKSSFINNGKKKAPEFLPRTPATVAEAGTSHATASISRLFTKGTHTSSTSTSSTTTPRRSALKRASGVDSPSTLSPSPSSAPSPAHSKNNSISGPLITQPSPSPSMLNLNLSLKIPTLVSKAFLGGSGTASPVSSGASTPRSASSKRISFAQLPESYASSRPNGAAASAVFHAKRDQARKRRANRRNGSASSSGGSGDTTGSNASGHDGSSSWWSGWLMGGAVGGQPGTGLGMGLGRQQTNERMEDRTTRSWGGRMSSGFGSGLDDWAV